MIYSAFRAVLRLAFVFRHSEPAEVAQGQNQTGKLSDSRTDGTKPRRNKGRLTYAMRTIHPCTAHPHKRLTAAACRPLCHTSYLPQYSSII